jgi:hypothetical protein
MGKREKIRLEIRGREEKLYIKESNREKPWETHVVYPEEIKVLNPSNITWEDLVNQAIGLSKNIIDEWTKVFPKENTLAWLRYGVPSLIVRLDFTLTNLTLDDQNNLDIGIYEIEDSPAGIGLAASTVNGFREKLQGLGWNETIALVLHREKGGDDYLWTKTIEIRNVKELSQIELPKNCWIASRFENLPSELIERSIWPVKHRKDKEYLEKMELVVRWDGKTPLEKIVNEYANKRKEEGIVFLGSPGSKAERIAILPFRKATKKASEWLGKSGGIGIWSLESIKERIERERWGSVYIRPFIWPMEVIVNDERMYGIFRLYFGYSTKRRKWVSLGGFLNTRSSLLIHGASDARFISVST